MQRFGALEVAMRQQDLAFGGLCCDCGYKKEEGASFGKENDHEQITL
mgnify:FL=1